jgi:hypothetical protein
MAMSMILEGVRDFLQKENGWDKHRCGIQQGGLPPAVTRGFYVALDDAGVETSPPENHYLKEIYTIEVAVWRETAPISADLSGIAQLKSDQYIKGAATLHDIERKVIRSIHHNQALRNAINGQFVLPGSDGDLFLLPLIYTGRGRNELQGVFAQNQQQSAQWLGRRLRFRGATRNQKIGSIL